MILIVDDDAAVRGTLGYLLSKEGYEVSLAAGPDEALAVIRSGAPKLIVMDMNYSRSTSGEEGLHLLRQSRIFLPDVPVILITAWGSIELAVEGMRAGAFDFITKPWQNSMLLSRVATALRLSSRAGQDDGSGKAPSAAFDRAGIIGEDPALLEVLAKVERVAPTDAPVLILGENGTGKELIARALHINSRRSRGPMVEVNLGGVPGALFESEMFGHAKGAFTGAVAARKGRFELADGGTIFLDEIGDLDPASQVKMLRVLQQHSFEPLGESRSRHVDIRVVSATNADLAAKVADHSFREDLFYRINLITLRLPPLRERRNDIPLLVRHFTAAAAARHNLPVPDIDQEALVMLRRLDFPGNIRQLKNMVERAVIISGGGRIDASHFADAADADAICRSGTQQSPSRQPSTLAELERAAIEAAMSKHEGNLSRVAVDLGITRQSLYRKLEKFNIPH